MNNKYESWSTMRNLKFNIKKVLGMNLNVEEIFGYAKRNDFKDISLQLEITDKDTYDLSDKINSCSPLLKIRNDSKTIAFSIGDNVYDRDSWNIKKLVYVNSAEKYGLKIGILDKENDCLDIVKASNKLVSKPVKSNYS